MTIIERLAGEVGDLPERLLVGFSGGCDSLALLLILLKARESGSKHGSFSLACVHVNHGLRGNESDEDEAFCRAVCEEYAIPLSCYRAIPPEHPGEGWARSARYAFFEQAMQETGSDALVLAHHEDDQAETILMHLMRGSGLEGLCGMEREGWVGNLRILRPLLGVSHRELQLALVEAGKTWREDSTNASDAYLRNQVRHRLLPFMESLSPGCTRRIAHTGLVLQEDNEALRDLIPDALLDRNYLPLSALYGTEAIDRRILRAWWLRQVGHDRPERALSYEQTLAVTGLVHQTTGTACTPGGGVRIIRGYRYLHLIREDRPCTTLPQQPLKDALRVGNLVFHMTSIRPDEAGTGDGLTSQVVPIEMTVAKADAEVTGLCVRGRQPGDWIRPFGQQGRQSLKEYLIDHRVDQPFRDRIPLICLGSEVLLVCGVGAGGIPRRQEGEGALLISWEGEMPWMEDGSMKERSHRSNASYGMST